MVSEAHDMDWLPSLAADAWQMSYGERAALEGLVAQVRPRLAVEIGTAAGGSLRRIATHSEEVHSFDLVTPTEVGGLANVKLHTGDSHTLLPQVLSQFADRGRSVDFVLVDGDHSAEGVKQDLEHLLASDAVRQTIILLHDTMNDEVRAGIEAVGLEHHPKVALVELDFVAGHLSRREPYRLELWGGLGLVVIDAEHSSALRRRPVRDDRFYELIALVRPTRDLMRALERGGRAFDRLSAGEVELQLRDQWHLGCGPERVSALEAEVAERDRLVAQLQASASWRLTAPLRALKRRAGGA